MLKQIPTRYATVYLLSATSANISLWGGEQSLIISCRICITILRMLRCFVCDSSAETPYLPISHYQLSITTRNWAVTPLHMNQILTVLFDCSWLINSCSFDCFCFLYFWIFNYSNFKPNEHRYSKIPKTLSKCIK
jgi:hypothetical protein